LSLPNLALALRTPCILGFIKPVFLIYLGVALSLLDTGCTVGGFVGTNSHTFPPTDPSTVQILFVEPQRPHQQIGIVTATGGSIATETQIYRKLQARAAEMGADAVVIGSKDTSYWSGKNISASAIKYL
jgi:Protein of unknown function (DUF1471)